MPATANDIKFMRTALTLAKQAGQRDEVPVGAVIVKDYSVVTLSSNRKEENGLASSHAELLAINQATRALDNWRLSECTLYVTLEPCIMCAGAIQQSRLGRVVFGALDPKGGAYGSLYDIHADERLNHMPTEVVAGVLASESSQLLKEFFAAKRK